MNTVLITGNTYPHRDALKAMGGRWDPETKGWRVPAEHAEKARRLCAWPARESYNEQPATRRRGSGPLRPDGEGGICRSCGDDCGGNGYRCGYQ